MHDLPSIAAARLRIALWLTAATIAIYFGFIALVAYGRDVLARPIVRGLTVGVALGAAVIIASWILTWIYVRWANTHYDAALRTLSRRPDAKEGSPAPPPVPPAPPPPPDRPA